MKFRPLVWRNTHPFVVVDRVEDLTRPELVHEDEKIDRKVSLYGYVRGTNMKPGMKVIFFFFSQISNNWISKTNLIQI